MRRSLVSDGIWGAFETDPKMWKYYGRAIEEYPNVLYTHTADMFASRIAKV